MYLGVVLPSLIHLNLPLQRVDLLIRILYDLLHDTGAQWLSQSVVPDIVK